MFGRQASARKPACEFRVRGRDDAMLRQSPPSTEIHSQTAMSIRPQASARHVVCAVVSRWTLGMSPLLRLAVLIVIATTVGWFLPAVAAEPAWSWPTQLHTVRRGFDGGSSRYSAGHRGLDIAAKPKEAVRSVAPGTVTFVGVVAGTPTVTVSHGTERSTYQPVKGTVRVGDSVDRGQIIGVMADGGRHCADCLHLGRVAGEDYLDPLEKLTSSARFRLFDPDGPLPRPVEPFGPSIGLSAPAAGPITSAFGMRVHPLTGVRKLHDGTDIGAACGAPVHAAAAGTVISVGPAGAYGLRVSIRHGRLTTRYAHLSGTSVAVGQQVRPTQVVGQVGSTGLSTGCHLHFMVERDGVPIDPMTASMPP